jgi:hypothetical protein
LRLSAHAGRCCYRDYDCDNQFAQRHIVCSVLGGLERRMLCAEGIVAERSYRLRGAGGGVSLIGTARQRAAVKSRER